MTNRPDRVGVRGPGKNIDVELPSVVWDNVATDADRGSNAVQFAEMDVADSYDDAQTIRYAWNLDELTARERRDVLKMIKKTHDSYDDVRSAETDTEFVVRLDYYP